MASKKNPTRVGFSAGDPNGIGLETIVRTFEDDRMFEEITPVLYATANLVEAALELTGTEQKLRWAVVDGAESAKDEQLNVVGIQEEPWPLNWGNISPDAGAFAMKSLDRVVQDLAATKVDVLVTAPIHKEAMRSSNFQFPGHTEYLANVANVDEVLMLLVAGELRVGICTGHIALKEVSSAITPDLICRKARLMHESLLRDFGIPSPRIAILGLNPHASDNGLMGDEEKRVIAPAVKTLEQEGKLVLGPYAADGFFGSGANRNFDGVLAMYHDQGLAPFKAMSFGNGVNFTTGLPVVRTSPDHGTGFDIAGKGIATADSMRAAVFLARDIRTNRQEFRTYGTNPLPIQSRTRRDDDRGRH
ncbi:MAG: 4-hydroxythreonine-4-phosphate dehydrogenase PdxA [Flavobacteriales bacterium]|nr:4-hydroxythreonine-4-phosphate dehydrogenase PdxA [Flavobacteriales bacterium]